MTGVTLSLGPSSKVRYMHLLSQSFAMAMQKVLFIERMAYCITSAERRMRAAHIAVIFLFIQI